MALVPVAGATRAVVALGLVALVMVVLIAYETRRYAAARHRIRHT